MRTAYLEDDIDHGLKVIRDILQLAGADTPVMDRILEWRLALVRPSKAPGYIPESNAVARYKTIELLASALD